MISRSARGDTVAVKCCDCQQCQRGKVHKQPAAPLHAIPVPARRFSQAHGPVGSSPCFFGGQVYLLTAIARSTRWVEAVPLRNMEASMCTDAFIANWVACFGVPATVTTNRGTHFGTPTKRQVSKRQVSKRPVSKHLKRQVYKMSGLQNVRFTKCQVYKTSGLQNVRLKKKHPYIFCTCGWWKSAGSVAAIFAGKVMAVFYSLF